MLEADKVSIAVKAQYEEHPYPFWDSLPAAKTDDLERKVLIAGCGTGREILYDAQCSPRSEFLGIDLSKASLYFARQKADELVIKNVRLAQLNLLDVSSLGETFDFIKSTGVLHHIADPLAGLLALKTVLRPTGRIKFSVYSKIARRSVLAAIELRKTMNIPPTTEKILEFREFIMALPETHPAKPVIQSPDFLSVPGTRDLLFHAHEHNFEIPELVSMIEQAGLKIVQWGPSNSLNKFRSMGFDDELDWQLWHKAEQQRPGLFSGSMYSVHVEAVR